MHSLISERDSQINALQDKLVKICALLDEEIEEKQELLLLVDKLKRQINRDYENSSLPSSDKPYHQKQPRKNGPETRCAARAQSTAKKKLTPTEPVQEIPVPEHILQDPDYYLTGNIIKKQVVDIEIKVKVTEYQTAEYRSRITGTRGHAPFPSGIRNEVSYGDGVKTLAFLLNNYCNVSIDKTQQLIKELTDGCICMSKGMINHLWREFSEKSSGNAKTCSTVL